MPALNTNTRPLGGQLAPEGLPALRLGPGLPDVPPLPPDTIPPPMPPLPDERPPELPGVAPADVIRLPPAHRPQPAVDPSAVPDGAGRGWLHRPARRAARHGPRA